MRSHFVSNQATRPSGVGGARYLWDHRDASPQHMKKRRKKSVLTASKQPTIMTLPFHTFWLSRRYPHRVANPSPFTWQALYLSSGHRQRPNVGCLPRIRVYTGRVLWQLSPRRQVPKSISSRRAATTHTLYPPTTFLSAITHSPSTQQVDNWARESTLTQSSLQQLKYGYYQQVEIAVIKCFTCFMAYLLCISQSCML